MSAQKGRKRRNETRIDFCQLAFHLTPPSTIFTPLRLEITKYSGHPVAKQTASSQPWICNYGISPSMAMRLAVFMICNSMGHWGINFNSCFGFGFEVGFPILPMHVTRCGCVCVCV